MASAKLRRLSSVCASCFSSSRPAMARLPMVEKPKGEGSSAVKTTTSRGWSNATCNSPKRRQTSRAATTPATPSKRPPPRTVSMCEPVMMTGPCLRPPRRPMRLPAASTRTARPTSCSMILRTSARAFRSCSEKARRVKGGSSGATRRASRSMSLRIRLASGRIRSMIVSFCEKVPIDDGCTVSGCLAG